MPNPGLEPAVKGQIGGMLLAGMQPKEICEQLGVSPSSVSRVKASLGPEFIVKMAEEEQTIIEDMIMHQLNVSIESSICIAKQAQDGDWLDKQRAGELATLYGVITDKTLRLFEAAGQANAIKLEAIREESGHNAQDFTGGDNPES